MEMWRRAIRLLVLTTVLAASGCSWYESMRDKFGTSARDAGGRANQRPISRAEAEAQEAREPD